MTRLIALALILPLAGCGLQLPFGRGAEDPVLQDLPIPQFDAEVELVDEADEVSEDAATAAGPLGTTLATLGDAAQPGLWMETPFVASVAQGRVTGASGEAVVLELRPSGGAPGSGSRLSLAAMQALGLSLTAIAEVSVEAL